MRINIEFDSRNGEVGATSTIANPKLNIMKSFSFETATNHR